MDELGAMHHGLAIVEGKPGAIELFRSGGRKGQTLKGKKDFLRILALGTSRTPLVLSTRTTVGSRQEVDPLFFKGTLATSCLY